MLLRLLDVLTVAVVNQQRKNWL